jgi:hypothetical protein
MDLCKGDDHDSFRCGVDHAFTPERLLTFNTTLTLVLHGEDARWVLPTARHSG